MVTNDAALQEEQDRRFEASRIRQDEEERQLRDEAGCNDECPTDCSCVEEMIDDRRERRDMERDFYRSRGI